MNNVSLTRRATCGPRREQTAWWLKMGGCQPRERPEETNKKNIRPITSNQGGPVTCLNSVGEHLSHLSPVTITAVVQAIHDLGDFFLLLLSCVSDLHFHFCFHRHFHISTWFLSPRLHISVSLKVGLNSELPQWRRGCSRSGCCYCCSSPGNPHPTWLKPWWFKKKKRGNKRHVI